LNQQKNDFLPMTKQEMKKRGWDQLDIIFISGDAYVDHPSFGPAILGRLLEAKGYRVGIIAQPDWTKLDDFIRLGQPKLFFAVSAGNLDSMLSNYTPNKRKRKTDAYSPNGQAGKRPDRATIVYTNRLREAFPGVPIIIGGIEASLRRFAHYDFWSQKVRRSLLLDSRAHLLVYGMGEKQIIEIAEKLSAGKSIEELTKIRGTVYKTKTLENITNFVQVPSLEEVIAEKEKYASAFAIEHQQQDPLRGKTIAQKHADQYIVQNPPALPLTEEEMDFVYDLPYLRDIHPSYTEVPAIEEVKFSITSHRGCFGGCSFCAITHHQGRIIQKRSKESIIREAKILTKMPDFKGIIHDLGGPTANFRRPACKKQKEKGACAQKECLYPEACPNLEVNHSEYFDLLRTIRSLPNVRKVFVRSGVRYDYLLLDKHADKYLEELCEHHVSGQLKVAPEHVSARVTAAMKKSGRKVFDQFRKKYEAANQKLGKKQYLVPYFMASHPGCGLKEAVELAEYIRDLRYNPEQVQDFTPTPGSLSTCIYYTGINPFTKEKVYVPKSEEERQMQRALMQFRQPANYNLVQKALQKVGRTDLIGQGPKALIKSPKNSHPTSLRKVKKKK